MNFTQRALPFDQYEKYGISQAYVATIYEYLNITSIDADNIESDLGSRGLKIFNSDLRRQDQGKFILEIIVAKSTHTF
jgi:hypothetical protein